MREIAERAGLAVGTIYRNYPSKDDLIVALFDDAHAGFVADLAPDFESPLAALEHLLVRTIEMVARYGWLFDAYLSLQLSPRLREDLERKRIDFDFDAACRRLLDEAIEAGEVRPDIDAQAVASLIAGAATPWSCQPRLEHETPEQIAASTLKTLLEGIGRRP